MCNPGCALSAIHYQHVQRLYTNVPVPVLVGQSNTNKSFVSKVGASLLGLHRNAVYNYLTPAKCVSLLGRSLWFIYNDPKDSEVLQTLITKVIRVNFTQP